MITATDLFDLICNLTVNRCCPWWHQNAFGTAKDQPSSWLVCEDDHRILDNLLNFIVFMLFAGAGEKYRYDRHREGRMGNRNVS
ncbi:hypothetical protein DA718_26210 [Klebsiella huaxiensis]|nr:hypothetical protein DA718_26210 [Klebsiella huaxiensis]